MSFESITRSKKTLRGGGLAKGSFLAARCLSYAGYGTSFYRLRSFWERESLWPCLREIRFPMTSSAEGAGRRI